MKYLVAGIILVASLAFAQFTPPSGSPVYDPTQTDENTANITTNAMNIATNTAARVAMGNWAWVQDGTNLIAVYTAP